MERFDVFVIGGGGTGSEVAFSLGRRSKLKIGLAERDKLGGECNHYGCVPTKVMLRSAKVAAWGRRAGRFGVRIPSVDVDFGAVIRFGAGLDSIAQAAGRCNRHGWHKCGLVHVVNPREESLSRLPDIRIGCEKAARVMDDYERDPLRFESSL
ncbi:MAG: FAD-dependent oxidoreductase, partial [Actinomycetota bacterium]